MTEYNKQINKDHFDNNLNMEKKFFLLKTKAMLLQFHDFSSSSCIERKLGGPKIS